MQTTAKGYAPSLSKKIRSFYSDPLSTSEHKLIQDLFGNSEGMAITLTLCFAIGVYTVWGHVPVAFVTIFIVLFFVEAIVKVIVSNRFSKITAEKQRDSIWRRVIAYGSLWSGIVYGVVGLAVFLPVSNDERLVLIGVFFGILQITAMSGAFFQIISAWMLIPAILPTTIVLLVIASKTTLLLAALLIGCTISALLLARLSARRFRYITELNDENQRLLEAISHEREIAESERKKAENAVVKNSRFMAAASHDLRQPLHAIGLLQHALRHKENNEGSYHLFDSIDRSMDVLNAMFDSLLDISQLDAKSISPQNINLETTMFFSTIIEEAQLSASDKNLQLETAIESANLYTDPILLNRIVRNLLNNALKFTDSGTISFYATFKKNILTVIVSDTGPGISDSEKERIFEEFYQIDSDTGRQHGVGLGLSIVSRLSDLLGIKLKVRNNVPTGTTFILEIPATAIPDDRQHEKPRSTTSKCIDNLRVLFIDNEQEVVNAMQESLKTWKTECMGFTKLQNAFDAIQQNVFNPDLLICDYQLGTQNNGLDVINDLRNLIGYEIPSILISGDKSNNLEVACRKNGIVRLTKPTQPEALKAAISRLMSTKTSVC